MPALLQKSDYQALLTDISRIYTQNLAETQKAVNRLRVKAYWEIGKRIVTVEQENNLRAPQGERLLENLSHDLNSQYGNGFSLTNLKYMRQFYIKFPIRQTSDQLGWSHYQVLSTVKDKDERAQLEEEAAKKNWSVRQLSSVLKEKNIEVEPTPVDPGPRVTGSQGPKLTVQRGVLDTYRIARLKCLHTKGEGSLILDLGFNIYRELGKKELEGLEEGDVIEIESNGTQRPRVPASRKDLSGSLGPGSLGTLQNLYTYIAYLERVIDGDTLWVQVELGFGQYTRQKLRLRNIDCPELTTQKGQQARQFVEKQLAGCEFIVIKTYKSDKYDRYLTDIFYRPETGDERLVAKEGTYLNQELIDQGLGVRV